MVLITGASGFIGYNTLNYFIEKKIDVIGGVRNHIIDNKHFIKIDLSSLDFQIDNISCIIHSAANIPNSESSFEKVAISNLEIDELVVNYCKTKNIPLIYLSSSSVYGITTNTIDETTETKPENEYAKSKLYIEKLIQDVIKKHIILRINAPFGEYQRTNTVVRIFIENFLNGNDVYLYGSGGRQQDFTYVKNITDAIYMAFMKIDSVTGIFNISGGNPISMIDLANLIKQFIPNTSSKIKNANTADVRENERVHFNLSKANKHLDWEPRFSLDTGIKNYIQFLRNDSGNNL